MTANDVAWRVRIEPYAELLWANEEYVLLEREDGSRLVLSARDGSQVAVKEGDLSGSGIPARGRIDQGPPVSDPSCRPSQEQGNRVLRCQPPQWLQWLHIAFGQPTPWLYELHDSDGRLRAHALLGGAWGWNVAGEDWLVIEVGRDLVMVRR